MTAFTGWLRVALIDMRGDVRRFIVLLSCLALGVATIAMVGAVGAALQAALTRDARVALGGDIEAKLSYRAANDEELAYFTSIGTVAEKIEIAGRATFGDAGSLVTVHGVNENYPLIGAVEISQADAPLPELLAQRDGTYGIIVGSLLTERTGAKVGDQIEIGDGTFQIRGILDGVPDQLTQGVQFGIQSMVSLEGINAMGLVQPGALATYGYKILLNPGVTFEQAASEIRTRFPEAGYKVRSPEDATEEMASFFESFERFLTIVGLSALLVGGVGVSNAVSAYVTDRQRSVATMRSLGATRGRILFHFLVQVMILTAIGIFLGLLLGGVLTFIVLPILGGLLGINLEAQVDWGSLITAAGFGALIGFAFGYIPVQRAQAMRPALLFRAVGTAVEGLGFRGIMRPQVALPVLAAGALTFLLAVVVTRRPLMVLWYTLGCIVAFGVLRLAGALMQRGLRMLPPAPSAGFRNAIKSIYRPGAPAPTVILSLGLGLALLVLISLIDSNLRNQLSDEVLVDTPSFVFFDLFEEEAQELKTFAESDPRIASLNNMPMIRGGLESVEGTPADQLGEPPEEMRATFSDEMPLTWSATMPESSTLLSGEMWAPDYSGPPLISVYDGLREPFGLKIGDKMLFRIFGEEFVATIANFRDFNWRGGSLNFPFVLSPGAFDAFPSSFLGLLKTKPGEEDAVQQTLVQQFPSLIFLPVSEAIDAIAALINSVVAAIQIIGGLALVSGLLVLAGAMAAGRRQREADAVVHKVLGATRGDVIRAYLVEYGMLGALSAILAIILGVAGAWGFAEFVMELDFRFDPWVLVWVVLIAVVLTIAVGAATTWSALSVRAAPFLRVE